MMKALSTGGRMKFFYYNKMMKDIIDDVVVLQDTDGDFRVKFILDIGEGIEVIKRYGVNATTNEYYEKPLMWEDVYESTTKIGIWNNDGF